MPNLVQTSDIILILSDGGFVTRLKLVNAPNSLQSEILGKTRKLSRIHKIFGDCKKVVVEFVGKIRGKYSQVQI